MDSKKYRSLFLFILLLLLIEGAGHLFTFHSVQSWYPSLHKPTWTPPSWLFGPVWTLLYLSIAVSGWLVFIKSRGNSKKAFLIYGGQLFCNLIWSYFFFFLKSPGLALIDISILLVLILINIIWFLRIYKPAGYLLIPYFFWTMYATGLNAAIWSMNR